MRAISKKVILASVFCGLIRFGLAQTAPVSAATIVVNGPADVVGVNGACSLREAIGSINMGAPINADCPNIAVQPFGVNDTINLTVNTAIALAGASEDANLTGDYDILRPVVINAVGLFAGAMPAICAAAPAMQAPCISGGALDRVFDIYAPNVVFNFFSIAGGVAPIGENGGDIRINPPALFVPVNTPDLTLNKMQVGRSAANLMPGADGGVIWNNGGLTANNSLIFQGRASQFGGGIFNTKFGKMTLDGGQVYQNMAAVDGGGIYNTGATTASNNTQVNDNTAGADGGGVFNASIGTADFTSSQVFKNIANGSGLGVFNEGIFTGDALLVYGNVMLPSSNGGGIFNSGLLTLKGGSRVHNNTVSSGGGIYNIKQADVSDTLIYSNTSQSSSGGGIYNTGDFVLNQSVVSSNTVAGGGFDGAGIWNESGLFTATATLMQANTGAQNGGGVGNNTTARFVMMGGAVRNHSVTSNGASIYNHGDLFVTALAALDDGKASIYGGNLYNSASGSAQVNNTDILSGTAINGGGVWTAGTLNMTNTRVLSNVVSQYGGGMYASGTATLAGGSQIGYNRSTSGGGVYADSNASVSVVSSRVYSNTAITGGGAEAALTSTLSITNSAVYSNAATNLAGGLYTLGKLFMERSAVYSNTVATVGGAWANAGTAWVTNTTFSGNSAPTGGAGVFNTISGGASGSITLTNVTIAHNTGGVDGGLRAAGAAKQALRNTLIANNTGVNCFLASAITSLGNNLDSGNTCGLAGSGDMSNVNPNIGALSMNAPGSAPTHALLAGSAAINSGSNIGCPIADQRGVLRPLGGVCDIGAYESQLFPRAYVPNTMRDVSASW